MSKLTALIREMCPNGVEYRPLGEVIERLRTGLNPRKNFVLNSPGATNFYVTVRELGGFRIETSDKTDRVDNEGLRLIQNRSGLKAGDVLFSGTGTIGRTALVSNDPTNWNIKEGVYAITPCHNLLDSRFLIYVLNSSGFKDTALSIAAGGTVKSISMKNLQLLLVPVPPLEVQQEIVRVLDAFTDLEQSLVAELELRQKQFEEYRLQAFGKLDADYVGLQSIATIGTGSRNTNEAVDKGAYPFYTRGEEVLFSDEYDFDETSIITAGDGVGVGKTMHFASGKFALHQRAYRINITDSCVEPRFVFHLMKATFLNYMIRNSVHASVTSVRKRMLDDFPVPVLATEVQQDIVSKLDAFESLIQSIEQEIALRRKQYEFYRDELLSLPPKEI
ncbi:MAG TPA: restriction endonuclease subunit S [Enteractinococcus sp.]